jgi:insulysin
MENAIHKSSCIMTLFQIGLDSTRSNMLLQLYSQLIKETCFNVLRTKEQLGYIVFSGVWRQGGIHGLQFIVQSHKKPKFLDSRIENFIKETRETIKVSTYVVT